MLNIDSANRYLLRILPLKERPDVSGQVVYVRRVTSESILLSKVNDCRPQPEVIRLSAESNDDGWYDATELVLAANCAITPRYDLCTFESEAARQYRNHLGDSSILKVCDSEKAIGQLCFIGRIKDGKAELSPTACFVIHTDDYGFSVVYNGFCSPVKRRGEYLKVTQRILRLEGSGQSFFAAYPIVEACNASYAEDIALKKKYLQEVRERTSARSTVLETNEHVMRKASGLQNLNLE